MELNDLLIWLVSGGAIVAISWLWEFFAWFPNLDTKQKKLVLFGLSAGVALSAQCIIIYAPASILEAIAPFFGTVSGTFILIFIGETFHKNNK